MKSIIMFALAIVLSVSVGYLIFINAPPKTKIIYKEKIIKTSICDSDYGDGAYCMAKYACADKLKSFHRDLWGEVRFECN